MSGFNDDWRCIHDDTKGCRLGGCDDYCAREEHEHIQLLMGTRDITVPLADLPVALDLS